MDEDEPFAELHPPSPPHSDFSPTPRAQRHIWAQPFEPPGPASTSPPPAAPALVQIDVRKRERPADQVSRRKAGTDAVNVSAFDDLPPVELYDPSWNTAPLRIEAGRLGPSGVRGARGAVLPNAFRLRSSDLEDEEEEEIEEGKGVVVAQGEVGGDGFLGALREGSFGADEESGVGKGNEMLSLPVSIAGSPKNQSSGLRKQPIVVPPTPVAQKAGVFKSVNSLQATIEDLKIILKDDYQSEIGSVKTAEVKAKSSGESSTKTAEMRVKVPLTIKDVVSTYHVVISLEEKASECKVSMRRSFADSFRISNDDFDWFCKDVAKRFYQLRPV